MAIELFGSPKKTAKAFAEALTEKFNHYVGEARKCPTGTENRAVNFLKASIFKDLAEIVVKVFQIEDGKGEDNGNAG